MTELEDFKLRELYQRTDEDDACISEASPNGNRNTDWEKKCLNPYKERLKDFFWPRQNRRCVYCRLTIPKHAVSPEIEHIIPKSLKPEWMYEPENLCLACKTCNTKKSTNPVYEMDDDDVVELPTASTDYKIIHPYYDKYSDNIELIDNILYKGKTTKGWNTITLCHLERYDLAARRAELVLLESDNKAFRYTQILLLMLDPDFAALVDEPKKLEDELNITDIVKSFKNMN